MKYSCNHVSLFVGALIALGCSSSSDTNTPSTTPDAGVESGVGDDAQVLPDGSPPDSPSADAQDEDGSMATPDADIWDGASNAQWDDKVLGHYALLTVLATETNAMGLAYTSTTYSFGTAELKEEGTDLFLVESFCHIDLVSEGTEIVVTIPDYTTQAIPEQKVQLAVHDAGGLLEYRRPMIPIPFGAKLTDIYNEALPTSADDPRVWDEDGDGKPGGTSLFNGMGLEGEIYSVRRERYTYDFTQSADGTLNGLMVDTSEQVVIGGDPPELAIQASSTPDPDPAKTYVRAVPLPDAYSCDQLIEEIDTLFPDR